MSSIFSTVEMDSWARDFNYENYRSRHAAMQLKQRPLSEAAYNEFKRCMFNEFVRDQVVSEGNVGDGNVSNEGCGNDSDGKPVVQSGGA